MFLFREHELNLLTSFMNSKTKKAMAIYGRRRVGKTELALQLVKSSQTPTLYFQCTSFDYRSSLEDFLRTIKTVFPEFLPQTCSSFREALQLLSLYRKEAPLTIILDEFPFLAKKDDNVSVEFQWIIDHGLHGMKMILMGSNRSFMRNQIGNLEAPLYGRFDEILEIRPFSYEEIKTLFPKKNDAMTVYATTGGVAQYVMWFKDYPSVEEAFDNLFFHRTGRLLNETTNLLLQELRETTVYTLILRAIGCGSQNPGQIAKKCNLDQRGVYTYLNRLMELGIVDTVKNPLSSKKLDYKYCISDLLFRFYYTFIEPNVSLITSLGAQAKPYILGAQYDEYLGSVYEDIARTDCFRWALQGQIPFMPKVVGKWWGNIYKEGKWMESEIDLIAYDAENLLIGECKHRTKVIGNKELENLKYKAQFLPLDGRKPVFLLFSKAGFTEELKEETKSKEDVILLSF